MVIVHRRLCILIGAVVGFVFGIFVVAGKGWAGQEEQFIFEYKELCIFFDLKHMSKITVLDSVKWGQWFDVTVNIGAGGEHFFLSEHAICYIALYINIAEIVRVYLYPVYSFLKVIFIIVLDEGGSLRVIAESNYSVGWEAAKKIAVAS